MDETSPFDYDPAADILGHADFLEELDERGLPPDFPPEFPVPEDANLVMAQHGRKSPWQHAAWVRTASEPPFTEYPDRLRAIGCVLERHPGKRPPEDNGMYGYTVRHAHGTGAVWMYHERPELAWKQGRPEPMVWYVSVVWQSSGPDATEPPTPWLGSGEQDATGTNQPEREPVELAPDEGGLYEPDLRTSLEPWLDAERLQAFETLVVFRSLHRLLTHLENGRPAWDRMLLGTLLPLSGRPQGLTLPVLSQELGYRPDDPDDEDDEGQDPTPLLGMLEQQGFVTCTPPVADDGVTTVRLTEHGQRTLPELLHRPLHVRTMCEGMGPQRLASARHACLRITQTHTERRGYREDAHHRLADDDGWLYQVEIRERLGTWPETDQLRRFETLHALRTAATIVSSPVKRGITPTQLWGLAELGHHPDGLSLPELKTRLSLGADGDDLASVLNETERAGMTTRSTDPSGQGTARICLTEQGRQTVEAALRQLTDELLRIFDGLPSSDIALLRDTCWRILANYQNTAGTVHT